MKINMDEIIAAAEADNNTGFCTACGDEVQGIEPDARNYTCESCGADKVYGAVELLLGVTF